MWPFSNKLSKSDSIEHKCNNATEFTCKIISPGELRKIANDAHATRVKDTLDNIKRQLELSAEWNGVSPVVIRFKLNLETEILSALTECGLKVDLSSRDVFTKESDTDIHTYFIFKDSVTYIVSF